MTNITHLERLANAATLAGGSSLEISGGTVDLLGNSQTGANALGAVTVAGGSLGSSTSVFTGSSLPNRPTPSVLAAAAPPNPRMPAAISVATRARRDVNMVVPFDV